MARTCSSRSSWPKRTRTATVGPHSLASENKPDRTSNPHHLSKCSIWMDQIPCRCYLAGRENAPLTDIAVFTCGARTQLCHEKKHRALDHSTESRQSSRVNPGSCQVKCGSAKPSRARLRAPRASNLIRSSNRWISHRQWSRPQWEVWGDPESAPRRHGESWRREEDSDPRSHQVLAANRYKRQPIFRDR
jgi:hypothetical protein